ncbi:MAG: amidohydrolase family protein [Planctomycetes bacterium]|nr:amidohydrolase family protein [Planctomycetota bacterium]
MTDGDPAPTRRAFLSWSAALATLGCAGSPTALPVRRGDLHVHLFGTGDRGSGCVLGPSIRRSATFALLVRLLGLRQDEGFDDGYVRCLLDAVASSGLDVVALVGQDGVYDSAGHLDLGRTHWLVPADHLFAVCARHPDVLRSCPSINPQRRDALDELERCVALGAGLIKIHPPTQDVDIAAPRHAPFFRRCADLDVIVLVHTGHEHSAPVTDIRLADPSRLLPALDAGCRVVACHAGSGRPDDEPDFLPSFLAMLRRHPRLYGDTSILGTPGRERDLRRLLDDGFARTRLVHGSDFPFPAIPAGFRAELGSRRVATLNAERNLLARDRMLKDALGLEPSIALAAALLDGAMP